MSSDAGHDDAAEPMGDGGRQDAGGCSAETSGGPADYLDEFQSGTRLKARYFAAPGMPPVFAGFYDTELEVVCDFATASDGKLRCLPRDVMHEVQLGFLDADCERAAYQTASACSTEKGYVRRQGACHERYDVLQLELVPSASPLYFKNSEECVDGDTTLTPGPEVFTTGAPVDPTTFVEGNARDLPGVCAGSLRVVEGKDGSRGPLAIIDVASGAACEHSLNAEPSACWPVRRGFEESSLYQDAVCSDKIAAATWPSGPECPGPDFIRPISRDIYLYAVGSLHESPIYSGIGSCEPAQQKPWIGSVYALGEPKAREDFASFDGVPLGEGRLRAYVMREQGTALMVAHGPDGAYLRDAEREVDCTPMRFSDGVYRCLGSDTLYALGTPQEYDDELCTKPLRRCGSEPCEGKIVFDRTLDTDACAVEAEVSAVWKLGAPATKYYVKQGDLCTEVGPPSSDLYTVDEVSWSEFPTLTLELRE